MPYRIEIEPQAKEHLRGFSVHDRTIALKSMLEQLSPEPKMETKNRKALRTNLIASWALRIGHIRVYYDVQDSPDAIVRVLAVGIKKGNRVWIGGEETQL